ncbi:ATP-binding protein [Massilia forsythiae]|uniref:ATP-binding protein n=1 Tax=Massilia forsythiae TaxID=2728020 RepID=UPI001B7CEAFA|nr:ATP-binding protein [Massilia forsythiae]
MMRVIGAMASWWADRPLRTKGLIVIAFPLAVLFGALVSGYVIGRQTERAQEDVQRVLQIQHDIQEVHTLLAEAATGVRGYLLTGVDNFLDRYRVANVELPRTLARLRSRIRDPEQAERFGRLTLLSEQKRQGLAELVKLGPSTPPPQLVPILISNKALLDRLRDEIGAMLAREMLLRQQSMGFASEVHNRAMMATFVAGAAGVAGALFAVLLFSRGIVGRVQALADNARRLERGESLLPVAGAADELGRLGAGMAQASSLLAARSAEAQRAHREAESANRAKTEFLSRTSHELRTPLNAILGFAQVLEQDAHDPPTRQGAAQILGAGRHLLGLIDEMLDITRIEAGHLDLAQEAVDVHGLLREALALTLPQAQRHGIVLHGPQDRHGATAVLADRKRLLQVTLNLLSNAVKYNRPGGSVRIGAHVHPSPDGGRVRIDVTDTGPGIPARLQGRLFTPFDRLGAEQRPVEGSGLGLALSKHLADAMGGTIGVDSTPGQGSRFWIELQAADAPAGAPAAFQPLVQAPVQPPMQALVQTAAQPTGQRARTVLYIEDNSSNLALVETLMARRADLRLVSAVTGADGLRVAREEGPELVLLDLHLPDMTGEEVLARLRASGAAGQAPVVVLSADALPSTAERVRAAGADDFLSKPLNVAAFFSTLDRLLA